MPDKNALQNALVQVAQEAINTFQPAMVQERLNDCPPKSLPSPTLYERFTKLKSSRFANALKNPTAISLSYAIVGDDDALDKHTIQLMRSHLKVRMYNATYSFFVFDQLVSTTMNRLRLQERWTEVIIDVFDNPQSTESLPGTSEEVQAWSSAAAETA